MRFEYCSIPQCKYNLALTRALVLMWEICQAYGCAQSYNGQFGCGRIHMMLTDLRVPGNISSSIF